jgi:hypothetical protein
MHTFRVPHKTGAKALFPALKEVTKWFETKRPDTNGYMLGWLEFNYSDTGFPRPESASVVEDLLTAQGFNKKNMGAQDTVIICPEIQQRRLYDWAILELGKDVEILRKFSIFGQNAHQAIESTFVNSLLQRGENQNARFVFQNVMLQRLLFRAAYAIEERVDRADDTEVPWPDLPPVDLFPKFLFDRIKRDDFAVLDPNVIFGLEEPQYKGRNKIQTGQHPPREAHGNFASSNERRRFEEQKANAEMNRSVQETNEQENLGESKRKTLERWKQS